MIHFDTFTHARYAKDACKNHKLLCSPDTIVDFFAGNNNNNIPEPEPVQSKGNDSKNCTI